MFKVEFPPDCRIEAHTHACDYSEIILKGSQQVSGRWLQEGDIRVCLAHKAYGPLVVGLKEVTMLVIFADGTWPAIEVGAGDGSTLGSAEFRDRFSARWPVYERDQSDRCRVDDGSYSWEAPAGDGTAGAAAPLLEHAASLEDALVALTRHARRGLGAAILGAQLRARCWRRRTTRCCSWGHTTVNQRPSRECWLVSMARSCPRQLCLRPSLGSCCGHPALADTRGRAQPVARGGAVRQQLCSAGRRGPRPRWD